MKHYFLSKWVSLSGLNSGEKKGNPKKIIEGFVASLALASNSVKAASTHCMTTEDYKKITAVASF